MIHLLGEFHCNGSLLAIDPCYGDDNDGILIQFKEGFYRAHLAQQDEGDWGTRNAEILILHKDHELPDILNMDWTQESGGVGVDSGQAGFINPEINRKDDEERFYDDACALTLNTQYCAGIYDDGTATCGGVFTSTGFGDGVYRVWTARLNNLVVAARIHFIQDDSIFEDLQLLEKTPLKELPLLIEEIKTPVGKTELEKRLKGE